MGSAERFVLLIMKHEVFQEGGFVSFQIVDRLVVVEPKSLVFGTVIVDLHVLSDYRRLACAPSGERDQQYRCQ